MNNWASATIATTNSNVLNALDQLYAAQDQDVCYVEENNRFYRWVAASTEAADGVRVVELLGTPPGNPGRWIVEGPPGPGKLPDNFANRLSQNAGALLFGQVFTATTVGGSPSEVVTLFQGLSYSQSLFDATNSVAMVHTTLGSPVVSVRPHITPMTLQALLVNTSGANLPAGQTVYGAIMRVMP